METENPQNEYSTHSLLELYRLKCDIKKIINAGICLLRNNINDGFKRLPNYEIYYLEINDADNKLKLIEDAINKKGGEKEIQKIRNDVFSKYNC